MSTSYAMMGMGTLALGSGAQDVSGVDTTGEQVTQADQMLGTAEMTIESIASDLSPEIFDENKLNRIFFLIVSFFFGLILDYFTNSIGVNAAAFVTIAFLRPYIMNFVFGNFYDPHGIKILKDYIKDSTVYQKVLFVLLIVLIHHFIMFSLESFAIDQIEVVFKKTFYTSLLSLIFCSTLIYLLVQNER